MGMDASKSSSSNSSTRSSDRSSTNNSAKSASNANASKTGTTDKAATTTQDAGVKTASLSDSATVGKKETAQEVASAQNKADTFAGAWGACSTDEAKANDMSRSVAGLDAKSSLDSKTSLGDQAQSSSVDPKSANAESAAATQAAEEAQAATQTRAEYEAKAEALGTTDMAKGMKNNKDSVKALQSELQSKLGKDVGGIDGKFGPKTEAAVKEFQEKNGLDPTGKVDEKTREALLGDKPAKTREELQDDEAARQQAATQPKESMIFGDKISAADQDKVREVAKELGTTPNDLMAVMGVETGGTFDPAQKAKGTKSKAVGLIQFTNTAITDMNKRRAKEGLAPLSKDQLTKMSFSEQMDHVKDYLQDTLNARGFKGPVGRDDLYTAVVAPAALNKSDNSSVYSRGSKAYSANKSLDTNRDGKITRAEITARVDNWYDMGMKAMAN